MEGGRKEGKKRWSDVKGPLFNRGRGTRDILNYTMLLLCSVYQYLYNISQITKSMKIILNTVPKTWLYFISVLGLCFNKSFDFLSLCWFLHLSAKHIVIGACSTLATDMKVGGLCIVEDKVEQKSIHVRIH
jgi:hypothetical protein